MYVVWADGRFSNGAHDDVALSRSTDGGLTWSAPIKINQTTNNAAAFTPSVYVAANSTVGVAYYDFRNNTPAAGVPTDYWIIRCKSASACTNTADWSETHVAGSFDIETAPISRGYFLGEEGLRLVLLAQVLLRPRLMGFHAAEAPVQTAGELGHAAL